MRFVVLCAVLSLAAGGAGALEAGASKVEITAPVGTPLNGYGDRLGRGSVSKHDPLWSRALYLSDGSTAVFIVNTDLCLINPGLRARVLELRPEAVPAEHVILTATHTHSGQGAMIPHLPFRVVSGRFMPEVLEATAQGIARSMHEAYRNRRRAALGFGTAKQLVLSRNRRVKDGPIDTQVGVILVEDADGEAIALVTNFAAHPTSVPEEDHYAFSADYPGFYYNELERLATPGCVAMFLNGAQGNQTIANPEDKGGWERTESVGRLLAIRAKEVANGLTCGDAVLRLAQATLELPPTLAESFLPREAFLQTLEINDLLLTFFPGEACVEIGLEMRRRALEHGYTAQFSVGLANDYLIYFVPRPLYPAFTYESSQNYYGPGIADWLYRGFSGLMSRGTPEADPGPLEPPDVRDVENGLHIVLAGNSYAQGVQRGRAFGEDLRARFRERVVGPVRSGALKPSTGMWSFWPDWLDPTALALPAMGMAFRPLLASLGDEVFSELEGIADGAGLPFDAVWLLQNAGRLTEMGDTGPLFTTPLCTMVAVVGERAGAEGLLVARNLDWPHAEYPVIAEVRPESGQPFVQAGFSWNAGVFTGMNAAGLVLCAGRSAKADALGMEGIAVEFVLRELLQEAATVDEAKARLRGIEAPRGYYVMAAGVDKAGEAQAFVVEYGPEASVRAPEEGLLLGLSPASPLCDDSASLRYARAAEMLAGAEASGSGELADVLFDAERGQAEAAQIWSGSTRHSVIFEPLARRMYVSFPKADGSPGDFVAVSPAAVAAPVEESSDE